ncbi:thermonuclease family protein [Brevundimonas sp. DC300-4]|uniref:thermonuclease family protein n=1 Tax=Brevundimonas sp. DC300-4 TaxID=2804594 RepID=UPI003CF65A8F
MLVACVLMLGACERVANQLPAPTTSRAHETFNGRVVGVADGDTITVLDGDRRERSVRLAEIDAPERRQPWGERSKQSLSELVYGQSVEVVQTDTDRYGRVVAQVSVNGRNINREMVAIGAAWAFREYLIDETLIEVERDAKTQRIGLWSMPASDQVEPWRWRRGNRTPEAVSVGQPAVTTQVRGLVGRSPARGESSASTEGIRCGSKRYCSQMRSCDEARAYLVQCRVDTLDGDGDGRPCEQLCS